MSKLNQVDAEPYREIPEDLYVTALLPAEDEMIATMVEGAELPALLAAIAFITGDVSILRDEFRPSDKPMGATIEPQGGMSVATQAAARILAVQKLIEFRDKPPAAIVEPAPEKLDNIMRFLAKGVGEDYIPLLRHELAMPEDMGAPKWRKSEIAPDTDFNVVIVGSGISGLAAAHRFDQAGVSFTVIEKNSDVGGTWWENDYPGCRLDTPNYAYSFSFSQKSDWPQRFSQQKVIKDYLIGVSNEFHLREHIRFNTEVTAARFNEHYNRWTVTTREMGGRCTEVTANSVVTAVGQLNRPNYPDIRGRETFLGTAFHSADWDHSIDLAGKRVAVVGTGASAFQIVPAIVDTVGDLKVFQRNPPWMLPTPAYHHDISPQLHWLFAHIPYYARWYRFWQFWIAAEGRLPLAVVDPTWKKSGSVSGANEDFRRDLIKHMRKQFVDRPDLLKKMTPTYPPGAKRLLRDNGVWAKALKQNHVSLITTPISEITPTGIRTEDGTESAFDVIIYATGFRASDFLDPIMFTGRGGANLHDQWGGDARAYLGIAVPNFPNLFIMVGPTSGAVINGSVIFTAECDAEYIVECFHQMLQNNVHTMEVREAPFEAFNEMVDAQNRLRAWGVEGVSSWYKNKFGRVSQNWPGTLLEYWKLTRSPKMADFITT